jgi:PAS fold
VSVVQSADADSTIHFANAAARDVSDGGPDELIGRSGLELVYPDDFAQVAAVEDYEIPSE